MRKRRGKIVNADGLQDYAEPVADRQADLRRRIRTALRVHNVTQAAVAEKLGVTPSWVSKRLTAKRKAVMIDADEVPLFAAAIGVTVASLLPDESPRAESVPERSTIEHAEGDLYNRSLQAGRSTSTVGASSSSQGATADLLVPSLMEVEGYLLTRLGGVHGMFVVSALAAVLDRHRDRVADVCADVALYIQTTWGGAAAGTPKKSSTAIRGRR